MKKTTLSAATVVLGFLLLTGCSQINKVFDNEETVGYKKAGSVTSLEVPPDLTEPQYDSTFAINTTNSTVSASTLGKGGASVDSAGNIQVLPESSTVKINGSGKVRWLEVSAPANTLWSKVQGFWTTIGTELKRNEPTVGVMETDWIQTRGKLPQGAIQRALGSILKNATDSGIRDRYTTRFEKTSVNLTRLYITHRGAELMVSDTGNKWEMRPRRAAAEAEMLNRLKAYLQGVDPNTVKGGSTSQSPAGSTGLATMSVGKDGKPVLKVQDSFDRTWVRTGSAITNIGFALEGQDAGKGLYAAIWQQDEKKKGFFRRLITSKEKFLANNSQQLIHVSKLKAGSVIRVLNKNGKPLDSGLATKVLERLKTELNR
jgi:outer membrane protein assembly factor BamC